MLKISAILFGIVFIAIGVLGFVPSVSPNGLLLGYFHVNLAHNLIHLFSGVVALYVGFDITRSSRLYFQLFGIIYGLVAILGFYYGNEPILGYVANNHPDIGLHVVISIVSLYLGFLYKERLANV